MSDDPLDPEQRAAVEAPLPAIAVLAGPGSGKTRVLSYRTRFLLATNSDDKALMLTFTNKAAAEMKARASAVSAVSSDRIWGSTFHTFALNLLRSHGSAVDIQGEFDVLDDEEAKELAQEVAAEAGIADWHRRWAYLRVRRQQVREEQVAAFGRVYEAAKRARSVVDFDDLVVYAADILTANKDVARAYGMRYAHLLVDEFQDTNAVQFELVKALAEFGKTVSVFADDDQAIYQFAGAEAANVRRFVQELGAKPFPLTINYRCREEIVVRANRLIAADGQASGRQMEAHYSGGEVRLLEFATPEHEADAISREIADLLAGDSTRPWDVAVLTRAGFRVQTTIRALREVGVQVTSWLSSSQETADRRLMRTCLSLLRGPLTERQARRVHELLGIDMTEVRDPVALLESHSDIAAASVLLTARQQAWDGAPVTTIVKTIQEAVALVDGDLARSLESIVETLAGFEAVDPNFSLEHLLAELALGSIGGPPTVGGGVKVASLHRTKGLQWPHVYFLGLEEGRLPDFRAATVESIREERRACFVGVCRAEQRLTLTHTRMYGVSPQTPSRFLSEMGF